MSRHHNNGHHNSNRRWNNNRRRTKSSGTQEETTSNDIFRDHWTTVSSNLSSFRDRSKFTDIEIKVNGEIFRAHKILLSSSSKYFEAMFSNGLVEEQRSLIEIHDVKPSVFNILINFIYKGEIDITVDNVQDILPAANMFELEQVVNGCCKFLSKHLDHSNCVGILLFAELHSCSLLKLEAKRCIEKHFTDVVNEEEFLDMPKETLKSFLKSEGLSIYNEFEVFEAVLRWVKKDFNERKVYINELLEMVRFSFINPKCIESFLSNCSNNELKTLINNFLNTNQKNHLASTSQSNDQLEVTNYDCNLIARPRMCYRSRVYLIGGSAFVTGNQWSDVRSLATVERLDTFRKQWTSIASMKYPRCAHGVAVLNGCIYAIGGENESQIYNVVEVFDPIDEKWSLAKSMIYPRASFGVCSLDNYIYVIGGWIGDSAGTSIERYNSRINQWEEIANLEVKHYAMGVAAHRGLIYIMGGFDEYAKTQNFAFSYNPFTNEWTKLRSMQIDRASFGVTILHDYIYVIGGCRSTSNNSTNTVALNSVERYSVAENTWTTVSSMKQKRISPSVASISNNLIVIGGRGNASASSSHVSSLNTVEIYDPEENSWRDFIAMPENRWEAAATTI